MADTTDYEADATFEDEREHVLDPARRIQVTRSSTSGPMSTLAVRIDGVDIERLRAHAERAGVGVTQMARQWLLDRLAVEETGGTGPAEFSRGVRQLIDDAEHLRVLALNYNGLPTPGDPETGPATPL